MTTIFKGASRESRMIVLESWAQFGKKSEAISALKELEKLQVDDSVFKRLQQKAKLKEVREFAGDILFKRLKNNIRNRVGVDLIKAKDLIEKK
ncbi:hypothetical protein KO317_04045 [Candidatus Micrarchaeota archaeon]|nr:hypothetical protein [Candidatus Micrarchaeota archaeon]